MSTLSVTYAVTTTCYLIFTTRVGLLVDYALVATDESVVGLFSSSECGAQQTRYDTYRDTDYSERTVINQQRLNLWCAVAKLVGQEFRFSSTLVEIRRSD